MHPPACGVLGDDGRGRSSVMVSKAAAVRQLSCSPRSASRTAPGRPWPAPLSRWLDVGDGGLVQANALA